ncbi:unnamed protein product [Lupinus luteus]|uniref:Uncharacterized protein n=1 Tax=Lupinus luteus TaxID=3873 RepID=A0AAV1W936_LUPLU
MPGSTVNGASSTTLSTVIAAPSSSFLPKPKHICFLTPTRRDFAFLSFLSSTASFLSSPASAIEFGISGPKDWLKEQKKKSSNFLLAPVDASRQILRSGYLFLSLCSLLFLSLMHCTLCFLIICYDLILVLLAAETDTTYTDEDLQKIQDLFRSAARDCVPEDRNSFVNFQANTGVEVCTFRLIVKNAASLRASKDPVKLKAEALLDNLIRSFTSVSGLASETNIQLASDRRKISDAISDTLSSLDEFEQGIKDCLEI